MTDQSKKNMRDFTIKMVLSFSLAISIFINILSHQANSLLKEEKKHLEAVNTIITYEATKLYNDALKKDSEIILVCGAGGQAALTGKTLIDMGYTNVSNVGAIGDWEKNGGPMSK